jgi:hypothetical protein
MNTITWVPPSRAAKSNTSQQSERNAQRSQLTSTKNIIILDEPSRVACPQEPLREPGNGKVASDRGVNSGQATKLDSTCRGFACGEALPNAKPSNVIPEKERHE